MDLCNNTNNNNRVSCAKFCRTCQEEVTNSEDDEWVCLRNTYFHKTCFICDYENCNSKLSINNVMVLKNQNSLTFLCGIHYSFLTKPKPCPQPLPFAGPTDFSQSTKERKKNSSFYSKTSNEDDNEILKRFSLRVGRSSSNPDKKLIHSLRKKIFPSHTLNNKTNNLSLWDNTSIAHTYTNRLYEVEGALNTNFRHDGNLNSVESMALLEEKHLLCGKLGDLQENLKKKTQSFSSDTFFSSHENQFKSFILPDDDNVFDSTNPILQDHSLEKLQEDNKLKDSTISNLHQNIVELEIQKTDLEAKLSGDDLGIELSGKYGTEISQLANKIELLTEEETQHRLEFTQNMLEQKLLDIETQLYAKLKVDPCLQEIESKKLINEKTRIIKDIDALITKIDNL